MKKDVQQSILTELQKINKQIAELAKKIKDTDNDIANKKDAAAMNKVRKKIGLK